jgi:hypothetical protein
MLVRAAGPGNRFCPDGLAPGDVATVSVEPVDY